MNWVLAGKDLRWMEASHQQRTNNAHYRAAQSDFIRDDEMLEINERGDNQTGNKQAIDKNQRHALTAKQKPTAHKRDCGQQLDQVIPNRNLGPTIAAAAFQKEPGD